LQSVDKGQKEHIAQYGEAIIVYDQTNNQWTQTHPRQVRCVVIRDIDYDVTQLIKWLEEKIQKEQGWGTDYAQDTMERNTAPGYDPIAARAEHMENLAQQEATSES
jgi:hypothetical protein